MSQVVRAAGLSWRVKCDCEWSLDVDGGTYTAVRSAEKLK